MLCIPRLSFSSFRNWWRYKPRSISKKSINDPSCLCRMNTASSLVFNIILHSFRKMARERTFAKESPSYHTFPKPDRSAIMFTCFSPPLLCTFMPSLPQCLISVMNSGLQKILQVDPLSIKTNSKINNTLQQEHIFHF